MEKRRVDHQILEGERALFAENNLYITDSVFQNGESPLKESHSITVENSVFRWKYPVWYGHDIEIKNTAWDSTARAGVWYTNNVSVEDSLIEAPKNFRRCNGVSLKEVTFSNAEETLWQCKNVTLDKVNVKGDYFAMNSENLKVEGLKIAGNYSFDGVKNAVIRNSQILSKDAFWNSENITVYDSFISGEYLGWNSKNLTLINCTVESLQGMCYIENLVMKNCTVINTTLAFEYSSVDVEVNGEIPGIKNPSEGVIRADSIGEIIMEEDKVDVSKTEIICNTSVEKMCW